MFTKRNRLFKFWIITHYLYQSRGHFECKITFRNIFPLRHPRLLQAHPEPPASRKKFVRMRRNPKSRITE
jgi:hypothetical protein